MHRRWLSAVLLFCLALTAITVTAQILTSQVDNARTSETVLTPANVNTRQFGKLFTMKWMAASTLRLCTFRTCP